MVIVERITVAGVFVMGVALGYVISGRALGPGVLAVLVGVLVGAVLAGWLRGELKNERPGEHPNC